MAHQYIHDGKIKDYKSIQTGNFNNKSQLWHKFINEVDQKIGFNLKNKESF